MNTKLYPRFVSVNRFEFIKHVMLYWAPVAIWASLIFWLSHMPLTAINDSSQMAARTLPSFVSLSVIAHLVEFAVLSILVVRLLKSDSSEIRLSILLKALLISTAYGVLDEIHQYFVPGRVLSLTDIALDILGAVLGLVIIWAFSYAPHWFSRKNSVLLR